MDRSKGSVTVPTRLQSSVRHTLTVLSSDWLLRYLPIGSHATPLTKLAWSVRTRDEDEGQAAETVAQVRRESAA